MTQTLSAWLECVSLLWMGWAGAAFIGSTLVICAVACVTRLLRHRSAALRHALWMIVLLRLLLPPQVGLPVPLGRLTTWVQDAVPGWLVRPAPGVSDRNASRSIRVLLDRGGLGEMADATVLPAAAPHVLPASILIFAAWLSGVVFLAGATAFRLFRLRRTLRTRKPVSDGPLLELFEQCRVRLGATRRCRLYLSDDQAGPCVVGILRPAVILPANLPALLERSELEPLLLHELAHVCRRDTAVIWLQYVTQILYWPNPLVWMANQRIRQDREQACDDFVLAATRYRRRDYGAALIKVLELGGGRAAFATGLLGVAEGRDVMYQRLRLIMDAHRRRITRLSPPARIMIVLAGLAVLSVAPTLAASDSAKDRASAVTPARTLTTPQTAGDKPAPEPIDGPPLRKPSEVLPDDQARILAARKECFPDDVCERLLTLQRESSRDLDPSGKLSVNMLVKSIDHDLNLWTGCVAREPNRGRTISGEIKLSNTSATDPLLILTDGGVVLPHRLARWKAVGPGEYELFVTLDRSWSTGEEKSFYWVVPSGRPRAGRDGECSFVIRNVKGTEGIQQLMVVLPPGFRVKTTSEQPRSTVRVGERTLTLWQRHVQADEEYRVEVTLERGDRQG